MKIALAKGLHHIETIVMKLKEQNNCFDKFKIGVFGHLVNINFVEFPGRIMHHIIMRMTSITENEILFQIGDNLLRFGPREFALMTGLNCGCLPMTTYKPSKEEDSLKMKFFRNDKKLTLSIISREFVNATDATDDQLVKLANLYFLEGVLLPKEVHLTTDVDHLHIAEDLEEFCLYPWGRVVFNETIKYMKKIVTNISGHEKKPSLYHLRGFPFALLAFFYESIPALYETNLVERNIEQFDARVLNWVYTGGASWKMLASKVFDNPEVRNKYV